MDKVRYCSKCGNHTEEGANFCRQCGNKINNNQFDLAVNKRRVNNNKKIVIIAFIIVAISITLVGCIKLMKSNRGKLGEIKYLVNKKIKEVSLKDQTNLKENNDYQNKETNDEGSEALKKNKSTKVYDEKEVFAGLLRDEEWLIQNAEYAKASDSVRFLCLDINNDGVKELLLAHEGNSGLAGLTLSVLFCDNNTGKITKQDINTSHGGYVGFLENSNTIVVNFGARGVSMLFGWKAYGADLVNNFKTEDNLGMCTDSSNAEFRINDNVVDYYSYIQYIDYLNGSLTNTELYPLSEVNIRAMLES